MPSVLKSVPCCVFPVKKQLTGRGRRRIPKATLGGKSHCCDGFVISAAAAVQLPWRPGGVQQQFLSQTVNTVISPLEESTLLVRQLRFSISRAPVWCPFLDGEVEQVNWQRPAWQVSPQKVTAGLKEGLVLLHGQKNMSQCLIRLFFFTPSHKTILDVHICRWC